jgi:predicted dehydrogenase
MTTRVGVIGCGGVSGVYFRNLAAVPGVSVVACAGLAPRRAAARAKEFGIPRCCGVEEMLRSPDIDLIVNLTPPQAHFEITRRILQAGKHAYSEKPLAATYEEGCELVELARAGGLALGCAPDTFLGAGLQTCITLVDSGAIGVPVAAGAFQMRSPPEVERAYVPFAYERGGGPLFDMGPYYFTALVALLGPIRRVAGFARVSWPDRIVTSPPNAGMRLKVEMPTYAAGTIEFTSGVVGTLITSYDVWASSLPNLEVYGREGTLRAPDPNCFGGPVSIRRGTEPAWTDVAIAGRYQENSRGAGIADMVDAMRRGRPPRASGALALHVVEAMQGFLTSSATGTACELSSPCTRPAPLPTVYEPGP